ncbi:MAG TPA: hypothetical protein VG714_10645 [Acidobacteriaceae bacterium]|nr:hypothetical protein [Acidobacteriaceae bacterium]
MSTAVLSSASAAPPATTSILRRVFSFPVAISSLLSVLACLTVRGRFDDPDMWWHLKLGEIVFTTHHIPLFDTFSFTAYHHPTVPHEWLAQLSIFIAYHLGGYSGLMLWLCLTSSAILIAGYALCSLYSANAKVSFAGALLIWLFATIGFSVRPQMIGYLFLIAELLILYFGRTRSPRWFYALPPLFAFWVNCHGSFSLGLLLAVILLFSSFLSFHVGLLEARHWQSASRRALAFSLALSVPALLLNPTGFRLVLYPFHALGEITVVVSAVSEWQPLSIADTRGLALFAVVAAIVLLVIVRRTPLYLDELLFLAAGTYLACSHRRLLFAFGILVAPIFCRLLADTWDKYIPERDRPVPNLVLILPSLLVCWFAFPSPANLAAQVQAGSPATAVNFIHSHNLTGNMLNDWTSGGYLIWAAPDHPVFIDGRGDPYDETGVTPDFGNWATLQTDPRVLLDKYRISFILLSRDAPMSSVLPLMPQWKLVYSDRQSVIFQRVTVAN